MIVVRVELWPLGNKERSRHLGTAVIANDGTGTRDRGNYHVLLGKFGEQDPERLLRVKSAAWRRGRVEGFPRIVQGPWDLLGRALAGTLGARMRRSS